MRAIYLPVRLELPLRGLHPRGDDADEEREQHDRDHHKDEHEDGGGQSLGLGVGAVQAAAYTARVRTASLQAVLCLHGSQRSGRTTATCVRNP